MTSPDVYEILNRLPQPDAQVLRQAIENLKTERDFERHERFRLDELRSELVFAFGFQVEELRRKLHECENKRDELQAEVERLREYEGK
jgi:predicted RNase H-like nuclease (RuvC/YqgF family)